MWSVFPARAGMSPLRLFPRLMTVCVPRASGDEPGQSVAQLDILACSPRERG